MRGRAAAPALAALVAGGLLAAGCGGGGTPSATEQWQDSFCSALNEYVGQISGYADDIGAQLRSPDAGTATEIQATVKQGQEATDRLRSTLTSLGPPPTQDGATAQQLVDGLSADLQRSATTVRQQANALGDAASLTEAATSIASIAGEVSASVDRTKTTVGSLQELNSDLESGFNSIGSCKDLQKRLNE